MTFGDESTGHKYLWMLCPEKCLPEDEIFSRIRRGDRIFISTGCGEPQYLVGALKKYVESNPTAFFGAELFHVWTLGVAPYVDEKLKRNFRHNSFFIGSSTRDAVNEGAADYTPIFLSHVPELFDRKLVRIDVAMIQASPPDRNGYMSLGISVDIAKAAIANASIVIAQVNSAMPRVHGDTFIHVDEVDFAVPYDEPLLEYENTIPNEIAEQIGKYVARIVEDGDTIQVGYGGTPNAILSNLHTKRHLGVHTELLTDNLVALMKAGVVDNTRKSIDSGKTVAAFCMGKRETYDYIHDNPSIEFKAIDYTNNPLIIARHRNMVAINSALEIDLTGQATSESIGKRLYSGVGGQADFMRGTVLSHNGKTILALPSTASNAAVSRIVPYLKEGSGVTLNRGDIYYVVTEYGIAYLHGKNIRERAMELISIAHPGFRSWLIEEAKSAHLIYRDQVFIPGKKGEYPEGLETYRTTKKGIEIFLRPMKMSDEPLLKDFVYSLSEKSIYRRFMSSRIEMPHEFLQKLVVIDYSDDMAILAVLKHEKKEEILGVARYYLNKTVHFAEVSFAVRDDYQNKGVGTELVSYLTHLAQKRGILGFTAEVLADNKPMLHLFRLFEKWGCTVEKTLEAGMVNLTIAFKEPSLNTVKET
nr:GNAT family N-acetyltransferase [Deltaproteobacteria bacterium]